jgi:hypothetical protein
MSRSSYETLSARDPAYIHEAARRGVFAYIVDADAEELQSAIDITLQRFAEYHNLQGAFGRRAVIEQAKGILMACHAIDQERAFEMLRSKFATQWAEVARRRRGGRGEPSPVGDACSTRGRRRTTRVSRFAVARAPTMSNVGRA